MLTLRLIAVLVPGLFITGGTEVPQDPTDQQAPREVLARALRALARDGCIVQGRVDLRPSEGASPDRVATHYPEYFQGEFEAHVDPNGRILAVSTSSDPGFGIFRDKHDKVVHAFYEIYPVDVSRIEIALLSLLDFQRMARYVLSGATWGDVEFKAAGEMTIRGDLPGDFVPWELQIQRRPPARSGIEEWSTLDEEVERLTASLLDASWVAQVRTEFTLDKEGNLTAASLSLVHTDGGALRLIDEDQGHVSGAATAEPVEGEASVYQLSFRKGDLTPSLRAFEKISALLIAQRGR